MIKKQKALRKIDLIPLYLDTFIYKRYELLAFYSVFTKNKRQQRTCKET